MSKKSGVDGYGTPDDYQGFENYWMYDPDPVVDPTAEMNQEKRGKNPDDEAVKGIGWMDQMNIAYNAATMSKDALVKNLRQYADVLSTRAALYVKPPKKEKKADAANPARDDASLRFQWVDMMGTAADWLESGSDEKPFWGTFGMGNTKLPFYEWSVIAGGTCPGAKACLRFCYSMKFWFRSDVYRRQLMNTLLLRFKPELVEKEFMALDFGNSQPFMRLHVHGDFQDYKSVEFWMNLIRRRKDVQVYAYSKSWELLLEYDEKHNGEWPENFTLNLSNGSRYEGKGLKCGGEKESTCPRRCSKEEELRRCMLKLPCVRGEFLAIDLTKEESKVVKAYAKSEYEKQDLLATVSLSRDKLSIDQMSALGKIRRAALQRVIHDRGMAQKAYACPGFCATCLGKPGNFSHACGRSDFKAAIFIGIH